MRAKLFSLALAALALGSTAALAGWQDVASQFDQGRLAHLAEAKQKGLAEAHGGTGSGDASAIESALGPASHAPSAAELTGSWRCRLRVDGDRRLRRLAGRRLAIRPTASRASR